MGEFCSECGNEMDEILFIGNNGYYPRQCCTWCGHTEITSGTATVKKQKKEKRVAYAETIENKIEDIPKLYYMS
jgi:hypothetical protein